MTTGIEPVRLMNVVPTLLCGGTEGQFMTLVRSLDPDRFDLAFACLRRWGPFVNEIEERGIPLLEYSVRTFLSLAALRQQARFGRYIWRRRTHIVHTYNFYGNFFAIPPARLARTPVIIASVRDRGPYLTSMQKRVQRYVCRLADCVLVNAEAVKDWLTADGYDPAKIVVIPNGVDLGRFSGPPEPDRIRHELGLPPGVPVIALVSRLTRLKGIEHFLEAAAVLLRRFPEAWFLVVGETSPFDRAYLNVLTNLADELGIQRRVVFTGLRSDVPTLLASVTVSVMPSLNEALSNVLLESMAAGAPVVATKVGGTPEALEDGVNGLLVPPGDAHALAASIGRMLENPDLAARLGSAARQSIAERFSVERMVRATEKLYLDLLARKQPSTITARQPLGDRHTVATSVMSDSDVW